MNNSNLIKINNDLDVSYISTLLFGFFYLNNNLFMFVNERKKKASSFYFINTIKKYFIDKLNNNIDITFKNINKIRILSFFMGWLDLKNNMSNNNISVLQNQKVEEYYSFLMTLFNFKNININIGTKNIILPYISIDITDNIDDIISLDESLKKYFNILLDEIDEYCDIKQNPEIIGINIIKKKKQKINITKKVNIFKYVNNNNTISYKIHCVICKSNINKKNYCLLNNNNNWILFNENGDINFVDINNKEFAFKTMEEVELLIYSYL